MKTILVLTVSALVLMGLVSCSGNGQDNRSSGADTVDKDQPDNPTQKLADQNVELCRVAAQELGGALKSALQGAMGQGGPVAAVNVCHDEAAVIARQICDEKGLIVGRTSEKYRNPANAPDEWEKAGLAAFTQRMAAGEKPKDLEMWDTVTDADGNRTFRYLKAIPTGPLCLNCHGSELAPDLADKLTELYPGDKARGFAVGDMRGAFTVTIERPSS